jgi:plastocyanin
MKLVNAVARSALTPIVAALCMLSGGPAQAGDAVGAERGKVKLPPDADARAVFVYLKGPGLTRTVPKAPMVIRQKNKQFGPRVIAVVRGTAVEFPNDDRIMHNVFSRSAGNVFDLGHYKRGASKSVTFKKAGTVDIYCNIHPQMAATVLVTDNDFVVPLDAGGGFELAGVPPGRYEVVAWMPAGVASPKPIEVKAGAAAEIVLELAAAAPRGEHLNKDNQPYGRYK